MPQQPDLPQQPHPEVDKDVEKLKESSKELKSRIEEEKRRHDLPLDSSLGDPNWDERAKDGHLDLPPEEDE